MSILLFLCILLILVLVHEFGHFATAKWFGIRVDEFAFGFPPRLFGVKRGETTYAFNALPLGGYVKIYGEDPNEVGDADRSRSFAAQSRWVQSAVVLAGIVANMILAWVFFSLTFMVGITATNEAAAPYRVTDPALSIIEVSAESPAATGGLLPGDRILSIEDAGERVAVSAPGEVTAFIGVREGKSLTVTYLRQGKEGEATVTPIAGIVPERAAIGIYMDMVGTLQLSFFDALSYGAQKTYEYTVLTALGIFDFLKSAVVGRANFTEVTGPVGIVQAVGQAAGIGLGNLLLFTGLISINLAVINVLPFPALDGGRFFFILIEAILRRPLTPVVANTLNLVGFGLLMLLMVLVTYHDIARLIR